VHGGNPGRSRRRWPPFLSGATVPGLIHLLLAGFPSELALRPARRRGRRSDSIRCRWDQAQPGDRRTTRCRSSRSCAVCASRSRLPDLADQIVAVPRLGLAVRSPEERSRLRRSALDLRVAFRRPTSRCSRRAPPRRDPAGARRPPSRCEILAAPAADRRYVGQTTARPHQCGETGMSCSPPQDASPDARGRCVSVCASSQRW
jgi:hypothetical protein